MDSPPRLETLQIDTGPEPRTAILWLHGLGADGYDFEPLVPVLRIPQATPVRFVFPHAPVRPVTINGGMAMRAWYDLLSLSPLRESGPDLRESIAAIEALGRHLRASCPRLLLGGFSQGGAVALATALCTELRPEGVFALSTYLPNLTHAGLEPLAGPRTSAIYQAHGQADPIIPLTAARAATQSLEDLGLSVESHEYPMAHQVCEAEISDLRAWFLARLAD
ncbi:alpha/beta hydrolase [Thioalkalivibrio sulfidiphilus]|uniref:Carboxylesterase n=1 Tax=Thioalkalivibrio sulfidiphilus (strain HL-EbGR7) TaxID=396588 RepID=B8GSV4_THISH|nr:carboxylesterase [Thioalkalivibrio sulfidiphilus]ACL71139.1 carboxylesterase [Thioalkalivibrio sulfidiphilus HL-EbGr7]